MTPGKMVMIAGALCTVIGLAAAEGDPQTRPASGSRPAPAVIEAPRKAAATVDGVFSPEEWEGAFTTTTQDGGELRLMHDGDHLFVGIRSRKLGYGSLCLGRPDEVLVLHSSAALGMAVYHDEGGHWKQNRQFSWCCRARQESAERQEHLRKEGWMASIGYMGPPEEMEYQIALEGGEVTLAVVYQMASGRETAHSWPESLEDDCLGLTLLEGDLPEILDFSPETWMRVRTSGE
jgi:hypothetical protein